MSKKHRRHSQKKSLSNVVDGTETADAGAEEILASLFTLQTLSSFVNEPRHEAARVLRSAATAVETLGHVASTRFTQWADTLESTTPQDATPDAATPEAPASSRRAVEAAAQ